MDDDAGCVDHSSKRRSEHGTQSFFKPIFNLTEDILTIDVVIARRILNQVRSNRRGFLTKGINDSFVPEAYFE
jgi:hypothetical protein